MNTDQKVDFLEQKVALLTSRIDMLEQRIAQGGMAHSMPQQHAHPQSRPSHDHDDYHGGHHHGKKKKGMGSMLGDLFD